LSGFRAMLADVLFIEAHVLGKDGMGACFVSVPGKSRNSPAACPAVLGHGGMAHGLERERSRDERSIAPRLALRVKRNANISRSAKIFSNAESKTIPTNRNSMKRSPGFIATKYNDHARASEYFAKARGCPARRVTTNVFSAYRAFVL